MQLEGSLRAQAAVGSGLSVTCRGWECSALTPENPLLLPVQGLLCIHGQQRPLPTWRGRIRDGLSKLICLKMFGSNNKLFLSLARIAVMRGDKQWLLWFRSYEFIGLHGYDFLRF